MSKLQKKLIEAVKERRELYDMQDENYMKVKLKNRIWADIAEQLNLKDGREAKSEWLKLRGSYRDARRRQMRILESGGDVNQIKPWRFQRQMSFLDLLPRKESFNIENYEDFQSPLSLSATVNYKLLEIEGVEESDSIVINDRPEESCVEETIDNCDDSSSETIFVVPGGNGEGSSSKTKSAVPSSFRSTPATPVANSKKPKTKKKDNSGGILKRSIQLREDKSQKRVEETTTPLSNYNEDPLYNFFLSMYQLTKTMPTKYQHKVRCQVFQAVSHAEGEIMYQSSQPSSNLSPFSSNQLQHASPLDKSNSKQQFGRVCTDESGVSDLCFSSFSS